jgi:hypothetical protein
MAKENDLVTVATASTPIEANIMKSKLESEGLTCFVADQNMVSINPLYSNAVGGVRVQVRQGDFEKAKEILNIKSQTLKMVICPECHSNEISHGKTPAILNVLSFFGLGVFFPQLRRQWVCNKCHHSWRH